MRRVRLIAGIAVLALTAAACGSNSEDTDTPKAPAAAPADLGAVHELTKKLNIPDAKGQSGDLYVFLPKSLDNPYWDDARKGMNAMAKELGVKAEFLGPQTTDVNQQVQIFESVLSRKPKGIAVSPNDPSALKDVISRATAQGIKVIAWDSPVPDSKALGYIGTDNKSGGKQLGQELVKQIGGQGEIAVILGSLGAVNSQQRLAGFKEAVAASPGVKIVATEESNDAIATATNKAESILQAHPKVKAIVGLNGGDAPGAATALQQAGKCGKVTVAGFDAIQQARDLMRTGCVQLLVSQRPFGMTAAGLKLLVALSSGGQVPSPNLDTGVVTITKDTLADYEKTTA